MVELLAVANEGAVVGGAGCVKRLGMAELDGTAPLAAGVGAEVCGAGIGAGVKENEVPGNAWAVWVSGLPFASTAGVVVFEDGVNIEGG